MSVLMNTSALWEKITLTHLYSQQSFFHWLLSISEDIPLSNSTDYHRIKISTYTTWIEMSRQPLLFWCRMGLAQRSGAADSYCDHRFYESVTKSQGIKVCEFKRAIRFSSLMKHLGSASQISELISLYEKILFEFNVFKMFEDR